MRTFNELLDDLEYRARWEKDEVESAKTTLRCMYHTRVEFIKALLDFINRAPVRSGVCCCGEDMIKHASGLVRGHEPVDMWDYSVAGFIEEHNAKFKEDKMKHEHIQEAARDAKQMEENSVLVDVSGDVEDIVTKAMYKAFQLGQDYWEQANSSYIEEYNKAPATNAKMIDLVDRARRDVVFILETAQGNI